MSRLAGDSARASAMPATRPVEPFFLDPPIRSDTDDARGARCMPGAAFFGRPELAGSTPLQLHPQMDANAADGASAAAFRFLSPKNLRWRKISLSVACRARIVVILKLPSRKKELSGYAARATWACVLIRRPHEPKGEGVGPMTYSTCSGVCCPSESRSGGIRPPRGGTCRAWVGICRPPQTCEPIPSFRRRPPRCIHH